VRAIGERRKRKEGARQVKKEKEQMRLSGYTCSLWFCEVMCSFRFYKAFKVEKMLHKPQRACRFYWLRRANSTEALINNRFISSPI